MTFRIDSLWDNVVKEKPIVKNEPKPIEQTARADDSKNGELHFTGSSARRALDKKLGNTVSPAKAFEQIKALPKPASDNVAAILEFKNRRAAIADNAIKNSQPPKPDDFTGLNGATRSFEYRLSASYYNSQIGELKKISAEAKNYPNKILSTYEAVDEINKLPRPDRNNTTEIQIYNQKRAAIADAALMYAEPPKQENFKYPGNQRFADMEFREASSYYSSNVSQLKEFSNSAYSSQPPTITDAEANKIADDIINRYGGANVISEKGGASAGRELAELARQNPQDAAAAGNKIFEKLAGRDRGDDVARAFAENLSVDELRQISLQTGGAEFLENLKNNALDGNINDKEYSAAAKIDEAVTGFNPNSLSGVPEKDAKTVDAQLKKLPSEIRESYIESVLKHPYGQQAIKYAAVMSPEGSKLLGESLGKLYAKNPTETAAALKNITDSRDASLYPYYYQSGLARSIAKSGNDDLIKPFAQNEINRAKSDPDEVRGYLNAASAYAGLSPEGLQNVMKTNPDFYTAVERAGFLTGGPAESGGFENGNIWEPGLGDLLEKASKIKGANGAATAEAIKLFEIGVKNAGSNFRTMEGAGAFFVEHAQQLVDKYTNPLDANTPGSDVLENFFGSVVYSPISRELKYNGGSLLNAIMGDENGNGGVIGKVVDNYLARANKKSGDREQDNLLGQRIGFLWSDISKGFFRGVQNYKDKWNDDKAFRDLTFDLLGRGLGKITDKFGLPGELVEAPLSLAQGIFDAKAENDKETQLEKFKTAFNNLNNAMFTRLNNYDIQNKNVEGMHAGFTSAYNWEAVQKLLDDAITN